MIIIGITGTLGAGKGTIVDYLVNKKGFGHYSVRTFLIKEIKSRGMLVNRDTMTSVANELRAKNSPSYVTDKIYDQAIKDKKNCIIESIRTPGEIDSLRKKGKFYLFAVDADTKKRFERIKLRKSETDNISFDTFIANEKREMTSSDPNKQNLQKCREMADFVFVNDGSIEDLHLKTEKILNKIEKQ